MVFAAIVALTLAGLPSDRFLFAGFLPAKDKARRDVLDGAGRRCARRWSSTRPRRVWPTALAAIADVLPGREVAVARELTKKFEECRTRHAARSDRALRSASAQGRDRAAGRSAG